MDIYTINPSFFSGIIILLINNSLKFATNTAIYYYSIYCVKYLVIIKKYCTFAPQNEG